MTETIIPWDQLTLNPAHCEQLRRLLGTLPHHPNIYETYRQKFEAADLAWLVSGMNRDRDHGVGDGVYHRLQAMYQRSTGKGAGARAVRADFKTKYDKLAFDVVSHCMPLKYRQSTHRCDR